MKRFLFFPILLICSFAHAYTEQVESFGSAWSSTTPSVSATNYDTIYGQAGWTSTESDRNPVISTAMVVDRLYVEGSVAPGSGKSYTFTLRKNEADTALTCAITDTNTTCNDLTHTVTFAAGDRIGMKCVPAGSPNPAASAITGTVVLADSSDTGLSVTEMASTGNPSASATNYTLLAAGSNYQTTEADRKTVIPTSGTFKNLYVDVTSAPASGKSLAFTINKNGSTTALTCTISDTATACNDTTHSFTVAAGDNISLGVVPSGTPTVSRTSHSTTFKADTDGYFLILSPGASGPSTSATIYSPPSGTAQWSSSLAEANTDFPYQSFTIKNLYYLAKTAPGSGKSYAITLRQAGSGSALAVTLADTNTAVNAATDISVALNDKINFQSVPSGTPTANAAMSLSMTGYKIVTSGARRRMIIFD